MDSQPEYIQSEIPERSVQPQINILVHSIRKSYDHHRIIIIMAVYKFSFDQI